MLKKSKIFQFVFQICLALTLSIVLMVWNMERISITLGVVMMFNNLIYKSDIGTIRQTDISRRCEMIIVNPFETFPPFVDSRYQCKWSKNSNHTDAICFDTFECDPIDKLQRIMFITSNMYVFGFFSIGLVWGLFYMDVIRNIPLYKYTITILIMVVNLSLLSSFILSKLSVNLLIDQSIDSIVDKISSIAKNNGAPSIQFTDRIYRFDNNFNLARTIYDICSGIALGLMISTIELVKKLWSGKGIGYGKRKNQRSCMTNHGQQGNRVVSGKI